MKTDLEEALDRVLFWIMKRNQPDVQLFRTGLSRDTIDQITQHLPFKLPEEIYQLYMWRNGLAVTSPPHDVDFLPWVYFLSLEDAVAIVQEEIDSHWWKNYLDDLEERHEIEAEAKADYYFHFFSDGGAGSYMVPCSSESKQESPVLWWDPEEGAPFVKYQCLKSMMLTIASCYEEGAYFVADDGMLEVNEKEWEISRRYNPGVKYWQQ